MSKDITIDTEVGELVAHIGEELLLITGPGEAERVKLLATYPVTAAGQAEVRLPDGREVLVDPAFLASLRPDPVFESAVETGCPLCWNDFITDHATDHAHVEPVVR